MYLFFKIYFIKLWVIKNIVEIKVMIVKVCKIFWGMFDCIYESDGFEILLVDEYFVVM